MKKFFPTANRISKLLDDVSALSSVLLRIDLDFVEVFVGSSNVRRLRQIADLVHKLSRDVVDQTDHFQNL